MDFYLDRENLYKKSSDETLQRCFDDVKKSGEEIYGKIFDLSIWSTRKINNAQNFNGKMIMELCIKWKIKHSNSSPYRPKMNGAVEAANKNVKKIIQKMVVTYKDWHEMLSFSLHAYCITVRTLIGATS